MAANPRIMAGLALADCNCNPFALADQRQVMLREKRLSERLAAERAEARRLQRKKERMR